MAFFPLTFSSLILAVFTSSKGASVTRKFTLINNCSFTIWPGILPHAHAPSLGTTGFLLERSESVTLNVPDSWEGTFWGRTSCSTEGNFLCATGDCGSCSIDCSGAAPRQPATLAEFKLRNMYGEDFYDVNMLGGYNLPLMVIPDGTTGGPDCGATGCYKELNRVCPAELRVVGEGGETVACRSACEAFGSPEDCCSTGVYDNADKCNPTSKYTQFFMRECPGTLCFRYDAESVFSCNTGMGYTITFCPNV